MKEDTPEAAQFRFEADGSKVFVFAEPDKYKCPKCGEVGRYPGSINPGNIITITIPELEGVYCMRCWGQWLVDNIPKMEKIENEGNA